MNNVIKPMVIGLNLKELFDESQLLTCIIQTYIYNFVIGSGSKQQIVIVQQIELS